MDTKVWRATLVTPQGFMVDASEWNAPAEKGAPDLAAQPAADHGAVEDPGHLGHVARRRWRDLPAAEQEPPRTDSSESSLALRDRPAAQALEQLMTGLGIKVPVASKGGEGEYGYVVLDDGKGTSLVQINVSHRARRSLRSSWRAGVTTLPDGTMVKVRRGPARRARAWSSGPWTPCARTACGWWSPPSTPPTRAERPPARRPR